MVVDLKQWDRVRDQLAADPEDRLTLAGVPVIAEGRAILLAQTCESVRHQRQQGAQHAGLG